MISNMSDEFSTTQEQFKCACVDYDPVVCFQLRYNKNPLEMDKDDVCECECHDGFDPLDYEDELERQSDYDLMKQLADNEVQAREHDAWERQKELEREYQRKYGNEDD